MYIQKSSEKTSERGWGFWVGAALLFNPVFPKPFSKTLFATPAKNLKKKSYLVLNMIEWPENQY